MRQERMNNMIHSDAYVCSSAKLGSGVTVWELTKICQGAVVGALTKIGRNVYIDRGVVIGSKCKIQNNALLYHPALIGDGVFIGPGVQLINDPHPKALGHDGELNRDWIAIGVRIEDGASIGAGSIIMPGVTVGKGAVVGAATLVLRDVLPGQTYYQPRLREEPYHGEHRPHS